VTGEPVRVTQGVYAGGTQFAICDAGTLIYMPGPTAQDSAAQRTLVWVDRKGNEEPLGMPADAYAFPRISPDGTRVAVSIGSMKNTNILIWDLAGKTPNRLTFDETADIAPLWTPDGKRIVFFKIGKGEMGLYWRAADGAGKEEVLDSIPNIALPSSWFDNGTGLVLEVRHEVSEEEIPVIKNSIAATIVFNAPYDPGSRGYIGVLSMEGGRKIKPLLRDESLMIQTQLSPDGRWMAYLSLNNSGQSEIWVRPFPQLDSGKWLVATGSIGPKWSRDGRELFYLSVDGMMSVPVQTDPVFKKDGMPQQLFQGSYYMSPLGRMWDLSPDGKRFLMIKNSEASAAASSPSKINIILNWFEELKKRVPAD
jgi:eukaryotic-like serine/threonine-protein kinase